MTSCATEEIAQKNVAQSPLEAKVWFDNHQKDYNATVLNYIEDLQWQNAIVSNGEIGEVIEVPFTLTENLSASIKEADQYNDHHRLMFVRDEQNVYKLFYVQIFANDEDYSVQDKNYNYYNIKDNFDGNIYVQELATNIGNKIKFKDGEKVEHSTTGKMQEYACVYFGWWGSDGSFTPLYEVGCYGGSGGNGVPSGGGENPGPSYGGGGTSDSNSEGGCPAGYRYKLGECVLVEKITNLLTGKAKCLNDLLSSAGNNFVKNIFSQFAGKSEFNIQIVSLPKVYSSTNQEVNGTTGFDKVNSLMTIEISTSRLDGLAALESARIILHEYIHADMYRKLNTTNPNDADARDFKKVFETYENQHNAMAQVYLTSMRDALKEFHKTVLNSDYNNYVKYYGEAPSDAFYEAMAWGGLKDSNVKAWTDLSADKKASINSLASRVPILSKTVPCP
ncbi:MAG: hypothetical protein REI96_10920 [Flavobacterium nitrogenifigens]|uniref:hypothetical protein n=1 Tax=Flavobacterium nitrogenifigens TaxID=1617283 RepID=UPI0028066113|nr:hypothetical protein [Flavobacterium nitrogenifigens]MDQ8012952.1 hypothetical protein [Flavobacterium nitrogenifigens]